MKHYGVLSIPLFILGKLSHKNRLIVFSYTGHFSLPHSVFMAWQHKLKEIVLALPPWLKYSICCVSSTAVLLCIASGIFRICIIDRSPLSPKSVEILNEEQSLASEKFWNGKLNIGQWFLLSFYFFGGEGG